MQKNLILLVASMTLFGAGCGSRTSPEVQTPNSPVQENQVQAPVETNEMPETETETMGTETTPTSQTPTAPTETPQLNPVTNDSAVKTVTVTVSSSNFKFNPSTITAKKGEKIRIILNNLSGFHDLKIDEFNVATEKIRDAGTDTVEFIADKAGAFEYYCSVGNHRSMGMFGTLTVQP